MDFLDTAHSDVVTPEAAIVAPGAAIELCMLFALVATGALAFVVGCLTTNQAAILTLALLLSLDVLAWRRFDQGRHPCFLFLGVLTLLQGGKLIAYCAGIEPYPLRIGSITPFAFDISHSQQGTVLLMLALSALCVYSPCRWNYRRIAPPADMPVRQYLPYLYLLFYATVPFQLFKNYRYYQYVQEHGGYLQFWINHGSVASSVPLLVRAVVLINLPVFVAIFVFERKKVRLYVTTACYFAATAFTLLMGLRGGFFGLVLALWYVAAIKSTKKSRVVAIAALALTLVVVGDVIQTLRDDSDTTLADYTFAPLEFVKLQGNSLEVTSTAVAYRQLFENYSLSYLWHELGNGFVANDVTNYFRGKSLAFDVPVFLNARAFSLGRGTGGSYIAEAYVLAACPGVVCISLLIGLGLRFCYRLSGQMKSLVIVGLMLPDLLILPRGSLLDWLSVLLRTIMIIAALLVGWYAYRLILWLFTYTPKTNGLAGDEK